MAFSLPPEHLRACSTIFLFSDFVANYINGSFVGWTKRYDADELVVVIRSKYASQWADPYADVWQAIAVKLDGSGRCAVIARGVPLEVAILEGDEFVSRPSQPTTH